MLGLPLLIRAPVKDFFYFEGIELPLVPCFTCEGSIPSAKLLVSASVTGDDKTICLE